MEDFIKNNIEEFERGGKSFIFFDISGMDDNEQFAEFVATAKGFIAKYPPKSVCVLMSHITFFDTKTKNIYSDWIVFNKPYVTASALIDINGLTRMIAKSIYKQAGQELATPFPAREEAILWLLERAA
jgi:hypothetical protein